MFGSALLFILLSQIVTGVCLTVYYVPSPLSAHVTLSYIIKEVAGGAFLRSLHSYGSSAMVVVLVLHFLQTFLFGSYKGRREMLWISGGLTALLVLGMTFTGYLLRWDLSAFFAGSVGTNLAGDVPFVGGWLLRILRGGSSMGALTLSRFYALHVFVLPASIFLFVALHVFLFRKAGAAGPVNEDPLHPRLATEPFYPRQVIMDMAFVLVVMGVLGMLAHFIPVTLGPVADPSNGTYLPRPEWYYLPFFEWLKFWDGSKTVIGVVIIPAVLIALVFVLPFLDRGRERRPWKRPIPVGAVLIVLIALIGLGMQSRLDDSHDPTTAAQIARQDVVEAQFLHAPFEPLASPSASSGTAPAALSAAASLGKTLFDSHGCSGCHGVGGAGGVGPALTRISDKFPPAQLAALLKAPNAGMKSGGMSALTLDAADMTALVSYLGSLGGSAPATTTPAAPGSASPASTTATAPAPATSPASAVASAPSASGARGGSVASPASAGNHKLTVSPGSDIYRSDGCAACHGEAGVGTKRAPALVGVGNKLSAVRISALLKTPNAAMVAGGMPPVKGSEKDIASLVAYLRGLASSDVAHGAAVSANAGGSASRPPPPARSTNKAPVAAPKDTTKDTIPVASAAAPAASADQRGAAIFTAQGCAACHGSGGVGTKTAPALTSFSKTLTPAALTSLLQHPNHAMQAGGMPAVAISAADMTALVSYLQHLGAPATSAATVPAKESSSAGKTKAGASKSDSTPGVEIAAGASGRPMNQLELQGKGVFEAQSCGACHGMDGEGGTWAAPALANSGKSFPAALLVGLLQHPSVRMREGGMPVVSVSGRELAALAAYVSFISSKPAPGPAHGGNP
ncbi:MAG: cytochrome b N-terminal domain-containing protein [Gemmatimonadota bacterium]|nr:cytochrome b N-terminal domain-containing protein [Gemmatimonadota bacterium]